MSIEVDIKTSLAEIPAGQWNALGEADYPFTRHEFLHALEQHHCLHEYGWQPVYFLLTEAGKPIAAIASYIKSNSYGELVFDHSWAQAYERSGQAYYPKLVSAIPYTPATGPRFLLHRDISDEDQCRVLIGKLIEVIKQFCLQQQLSGWHLLFPREALVKSIPDQQLLLRYDCQYHWSNDSYRDFDDFLSRLSSRKRKNIRKERATVAAQQLQIEQRYGHDLTEQQWSRVHQLYAGIFQRKYGTPTLTEAFFQSLHNLERRVMVVLVSNQQQIIAASLFFISDDTLFGRVWGCDEYFDFLHFECCYYQGIDYCIEHGLSKFDPGAQGEHKISRGFLPTQTCSAHWLAEPQFHQMIDTYLRQEKTYIDDYCRELFKKSPYRNEESA
ncbi:MAG: GNAT family N-acetyltransferase [Gammaproteobacteria bacterium]|nr:GNAT family N-acetyltransferase [Gammaproteobacteria bacterium]